MWELIESWTGWMGWIAGAAAGAAVALAALCAGCDCPASGRVTGKELAPGEGRQRGKPHGAPERRSAPDSAT